MKERWMNMNFNKAGSRVIHGECWIALWHSICSKMKGLCNTSQQFEVALQSQCHEEVKVYNEIVRQGLEHYSAMDKNNRCEFQSLEYVTAQVHGCNWRLFGSSCHFLSASALSPSTKGTRKKQPETWSLTACWIDLPMRNPDLSICLRIFRKLGEPVYLTRTFFLTRFPMKDVWRCWLRTKSPGFLVSRGIS